MKEPHDNTIKSTPLADYVRNITFNPTFGYGTETALDCLCRTAASEGFELVRIVPHTQYEAVAVFRREERTDEA